MQQAGSDKHTISMEALCATTSENISDYDTLSPAPLSPYDGSTPPDPGFVTPRTPQTTSPVSPYVNVAFEDLIQAGQMLDAVPVNKNDPDEPPKKFCSLLENTSVLAHLAAFGVLGVLIRYSLGRLFDNVGHVTSAQTALFHDLAANMFGSFFMGWVGCVLKKDISHFSEHLALGLSTGLMGSITTFSSWIVKLVVVMTKGLWLRGVIGLLVGMELSMMSLLVGMQSAEWFRSLLIWLKLTEVAADNVQRKLKGLLIFLTTALVLWTLFLSLGVEDINNLERRTLWLACVLSPPGVWLRWLLARHNGKGLGHSKTLRWIPWGTLAANLLACLTGATLSAVQLAARNNHESTLWIGALHLGTLGCLSTVSTFVVEVHTLAKGDKPWRAYVYAMTSIGLGVLLCIVFFATVVWVRGYDIVL
ncbi:fluoride export protein 2-like isoform X2 [Selaginella moellendorffii]|uniref:fluoride export protein 2-like isoform X2 n=1 Tax=Selaginella moellendorffii TaxID=88036 RepID=UPI000D1CA79A|nr:fluoride export protein 2-like isoform X2 [Selaginella moellendorffii]|eukprot:XP_024523609.1 fluoride export protein 2-like isoform X2 [Selaginella moellendorffii]